MGTVVDPITEEVVRLSRDGYRMFRENDPAFLDRMDPEIEWHVPDTLPGGGDLRGPLEVVEFLDTMSGLWEDAYPEPEERDCSCPYDEVWTWRPPPTISR